MAPKQPNILFLLTDQHNHRALGSYPAGDRAGPVSTPNLDALADKSTVFSNAYCSVPVCGPSRLTMLTGRRAPEAGAWDNHFVLRPELETFAESLSDAGYRTCVVGKMHLAGSRQYGGFQHRPYGDLTGRGGHQLEPPDPDWNLDFGSFVKEVGPTNIPESLTQDRNVAEESLAFIRDHARRHQDQPLFLQASFNRPHWPRRAPQRFLQSYWPEGAGEPAVSASERVDHPLPDHLEGIYVPSDLDHEQVKRARGAYFASLEFVDEVIGGLLRRLEADGLLENTVIVYASDHGDMIGEQGLWEKRIWYDDASRVPLLVQLPGHRSGRQTPATVDTPVSLIDLYPTFCEFADAEIPDGLDGTGLAEAVRSGTEPDRGPVVCDAFFEYKNGSLDFRMVRDGKYKYVQFCDAPSLLFDLEADPRERDNLLNSDEQEPVEAAARLKQFVTESIDFDAVSEQRLRDDELKEEYALGIPTGRSNAYRFPDGRIIDADSPLYQPHVLAERPSLVFVDFPKKK